MEIRELDVRDVGSVVAMGRDEWPNIWPDVEYDADHIRAIVLCHIYDNSFSAWVLVDADDVVFGFFGLCLSPTIMTRKLVAEETWWYVDPRVRGRHGLRLLAVGEVWAQSRGAAAIHVGVHDEKYRPILERVHYKLSTLNFEKAL